MYQQYTSGTMYKKRPGTSGIRGQLYETKLISLLLYRARHNDDIEDINLASNVDEIGAFDDICFRAKVRGYDRPVAVFIQAKHRENNKALIVDDENDLTKYFDSYLKIRRAFKLNNKENVLFDGQFEETECLFVLYTTANGDQNKNSPKVRFAKYLNDLIGTDGTIGYHPSYDNESVELLYKLVIKDQMTILAVTIAKFICDKADFRTLLNDELVLRYHVILAQKVLFISEIQPAGHRVATFREDFFTSNEEFMTSFKEMLFMEVLKGRKPELLPVCTALDQCFDDLPTPDILCDLIGNVVTYNKHGKLEFIDKTMPEHLKHKLKEVDVCQFTVNTAINLAGKKMLSARSFKVPTAFGNKDLTIRGNDEKIEKRLNHLTSQIYDLLEKSHPNNIVTIDDTLRKGFLQVNGGIAGAVSNLLVLDENSKMMKFTDNCELLGKLSNRLFTKLKVKIQDLHKYKFEVKVENFPKLSLEYSEHDKNMVKDFMKKLIYYTNQADENRVEEILKNEIENHEYNNASNFRVRSDAIYLTYHNEIQKWWMSPKEGLLLTKHTITHDTTISRIVEQPLLRIMNVIYRNKLNHNIIHFTFREDAITSLNDVPFSNTMIVTDTIALTAAKVLQILENKDYFVLDLEYILNLPASDCHELCAELMKTNENKILVFVCENVLNPRNLSKTFENIAKAISEKMKIIITSQVSVDIIKKQFPHFFHLVKDESNNLNSMNLESRENILNNSKVLFQDVLISLDLIIDENSLAIIEGDVLNSVISKKTIVVGKSLGNSNYEEIKHLYVNRWASRAIKNNNGYYDYKMKIRTLNDIPDDVVLITAKPGMGKSTLLSHISLETKRLNPNVWIIKINLLEYAREFSKWRENKTKIDVLESLNFMCQFVVSEKHGKINKLTIDLEESNGIVSLKDCLGDQWTLFELNLFLHFYNRGQIIFVFDGFDEICPNYTIEVMEFLKSVRRYPRKHKMWIASRSYNKIKSILQHEFGKSYEILNFNSVERVKYIHKFWKSNLLLKEFNKEQLNNVYDFIKFINEHLKPVGNFLTKVKLPNLLLQEIYFNAFYYLKFEVKNTNIPLWTFETKFDDDTNSEIEHSSMRYNGDTYDYYYMYEFFGTPLHLYLLVNYFQAEIKDVSRKCNKWNLDINTLTIYDRFLETKLKKIRFQEKNKMDIHNPDILFTYEKERADFFTKHKKMAAYAIFHRRNNLIFNRKELKEIKNMIKLIKRGEEKTGVTYSVTSNNIPIFIHRSFAEYFAVEYFCDLLKKEKCTEKQKTMMDFIFNVMFFEISSNVRSILDSKIKVDKALMRVLQKNGKAIFDLLMEQAKGYPAYGITDVQNEFYEIKYESSFDIALSDNLNNFVFLFISIFKTHLTKDNIDNFIKIINETGMFDIAIRVNCEEFITFSLDIVRNIDESKFRNLFNSRNFSIFVNLSSNSNEEILEILRQIAFLTTSTTTPYCMYDPDTNSYYFVLKPYH